MLNAGAPGKGAWLTHWRHGGGTLCSNGPGTQKVPEDVLDLVAWGHWVTQEKDAGVNPASAVSDFLRRGAGVTSLNGGFLTRRASPEALPESAVRRDGGPCTGCGRHGSPEQRADATIGSSSRSDNVRSPALASPIVLSPFICSKK